MNGWPKLVTLQKSSRILGVGGYFFCAFISSTIKGTIIITIISMICISSKVLIKLPSFP